MDTLNNIKNTWQKANKKISADKSLNVEFIKKSITANSISITSALLKSIKGGVVLLAIDIVLFIYNIYFYAGNIPVLSAILLSLLLSSALLVNLIVQAKKLNNIDLQDSSLREILVSKIRYYKTSFYWILQSMALATAFLPFSVNLTQESADGEFNISKIFLLIGFYILVYLFSISLFRITHSIYLKQLMNALNNLEKNILDEMEKELAKSKRIRKIIGISLLIITLVGIIMFIKETVF